MSDESKLGVSPLNAGCEKLSIMCKKCLWMSRSGHG